jgi:hypothetical protein
MAEEQKSKGELLLRQQIPLLSIPLFLRIQHFFVNKIEKGHGDVVAESCVSWERSLIPQIFFFKKRRFVIHFFKIYLIFTKKI